MSKSIPFNSNMSDSESESVDDINTSTSQSVTEDNDTSNHSTSQIIKQKPLNINEMLQRALEKASDPGLGDEEPEVLLDPNSNEISNEEKEKKRNLELLRAEERRVLEAQIAYEAAQSLAMMEAKIATQGHKRQSMLDRAKYIPLRLTYEERKTLRLVNAAINVSDYTNVIDIPYKNKAKRQHTQLQQVVAFLSGLISAVDYEKGQQVLQDRNFSPFQQMLADMLEVARRYKVTNPEKMRSEYGKLIYLMQDAVSDSIRPLLGINIFKPMITVYTLLESHNCLHILDDPLIYIATDEILPSKSKTRQDIQIEIKRKEKAIDKLVHKYNIISGELLKQCLYSISDNNSFLNSNKKPVEDCIVLLQSYFSSVSVEPGYSLSINEGAVGARLTHTHEMQYHYVHQSLALWAAILQDMFRLWYLSECDLLSPTTPYDLRVTGQGLQRVQDSPMVYRAMHEILSITKIKLGQWVGSSVIHLGDNNVPNALTFIDKYTQVARILGPLVITLNNLETACTENEGIARYMNAYGGLKKAVKDILHDFFRFAFDGSGGFNDFEAGSCIDGRLTSAWNWCSQLANKSFYPLFKLTGFLSFDGEFEK